MAIDKNGTGYTIFFVIIMVVVVGTILAVLKLSLKDLQKANEADKKKMDILASVGIPSTRDNAKEEFEKFIPLTNQFLLTADGQMVEGEDPLSVDIKKQARGEGMKAFMNAGELCMECKYPLYKAEVGGKTKFILPMVGKGLWGPVWGYVALNDDLNTIFGASFDHKTETPGLGAEIKEDFFEEVWKDKTIRYYEEPHFEVTKGAGSATKNYQVDGITGGTITSKGVQKMFNKHVDIYMNYFKAQGLLAAN